MAKIYLGKIERGVGARVTEGSWGMRGGANSISRKSRLHTAEINCSVATTLFFGPPRGYKLHYSTPYGAPPLRSCHIFFLFNLKWAIDFSNLEMRRKMFDQFAMSGWLKSFNTKSFLWRRKKTVQFCRLWDNFWPTVTPHGWYAKKCIKKMERGDVVGRKGGGSIPCLARGSSALGVDRAPSGPASLGNGQNLKPPPTPLLKHLLYPSRQSTIFPLPRPPLQPRPPPSRPQFFQIFLLSILPPPAPPSLRVCTSKYFFFSPPNHFYPFLLLRRQRESLITI